MELVCWLASLRTGYLRSVTAVLTRPELPLRVAVETDHFMTWTSAYPFGLWSRGFSACHYTNPFL